MNRPALAATLVAVLAWLVSQTPAAMAAQAQSEFVMQAQQKTNWCWSASGVSIAAHHGTTVTQNQFCALAKNLDPALACPNDQADLAQVRNGFAKLGYTRPGRYLANYLSYPAIRTQIDYGQPIETRILWKAGGGHMHVLYGYDATKSWVYWGDPWPDNTRYSWATYGYYVNNPTFGWTHTLTGIAR